MSPGTIGLTKDSGYQAGARLTMAASPAGLWRLLLSARGQALLGQANEAIHAGTPGISTFVEGSHYRQLVAGDSGRPGLLQVRVIPAAHGRATLALHADKLGGPEERAGMIARFKQALTAFEEELAAKRDPG